MAGLAADTVPGLASSTQEPEGERTPHQQVRLEQAPEPEPEPEQEPESEQGPEDSGESRVVVKRLQGDRTMDQMMPHTATVESIHDQPIRDVHATSDSGRKAQDELLEVSMTDDSHSRDWASDEMDGGGDDGAGSLLIVCPSDASPGDILNVTTDPLLTLLYHQTVN